MRYVFSFFLMVFMSMPGWSATSYIYGPTRLKLDKSQGTWSLRGQTVGFVVGADYQVTAIGDGGERIFESGSIVITPQGSLPTAAALKSAITTDATNKGLRAKLDTRLSAAVTANQKDIVPVAGLIVIEGDTITLP